MRAATVFQRSVQLTGSQERSPEMNCMEARRMVTPFIKKELTDKEAEQFLKHIEHCSDCMDELDIYFTVYKALDTLDSGVHNEYDFRKLMEEYIRSVKRGILTRRVTKALRGVTLVLAELLLLLSVFTGIEVKRNEAQQSTFHRAIYRLRGGDGTRIEMRKKAAEEETDGTENLSEEEETDKAELRAADTKQDTSAKLPETETATGTGTVKRKDSEIETMSEKADSEMELSETEDVIKESGKTKSSATKK
jgi:hypothetical protein